MACRVPHRPAAAWRGRDRRAPTGCARTAPLGRRARATPLRADDSGPTEAASAESLKDRQTSRAAPPSCARRRLCHIEGVCAEFPNLRDDALVLHIIGLAPSTWQLSVPYNGAVAGSCARGGRVAGFTETQHDRPLNRWKLRCLDWATSGSSRRHALPEMGTA